VGAIVRTSPPTEEAFDTESTFGDVFITIEKERA
jgi:hypothetical protein